MPREVVPSHQHPLARVCNRFAARVAAQELAAKEDVLYVPGGATQNSIRVAQWLLKTPGSTSYFGSVGKDDFGDKMAAYARKDGVDVRSCHLSPQLIANSLEMPSQAVACCGMLHHLRGGSFMVLEGTSSCSHEHPAGCEALVAQELLSIACSLSILLNLRIVS